ncbi:RadC family protein [Cesiribacter sp. SM1]|uniref:JAB domain-containing protein n=1 Tax=Cesiribacter sp. SM1 TaxID=2861196 RepID=UPI001CD73D9C|nr:JAB domain-containing protein [Cesiribacter sp. SM1]
MRKISAIVSSQLNLDFSTVSEIQLYYRPKIKPSQRPKIDSSQSCYELLLKIWDSGNLEFVEEFKTLLLNRANKVIGVAPVSKGGFSGTVADPKVIFGYALKAAASSLILVHNHPSGNLKPSEADIRLTRKIKEAGKLLDLPVLDHLIITAEGYYSFADEGLL